MGFFSERREARRAGNINKRNEQRKALDPILDKKKLERIAYLNGRDKRLNEIAERKSQNPQVDQSSHETNLNLTQNKNVTKKYGVVDNGNSNVITTKQPKLKSDKVKD